MSREFSIVRRKPQLVDMVIDARSSTAYYMVYASNNFDGSFSKFATLPASGKKSVSVNIVEYPDSRYRGKTRFLFNPNDYADAGLLESVIILANTLKADYESHRLFAGGVHGAADIVDVVTAPDASDLLTVITLLNDIKVQYEAHRVLIAGGEHGAPDNTNVVTAPNATDLASAAVLALDLQVQYNAHRILTSGGEHGAPDDLNLLSSVLSLLSLDDAAPFYMKIVPVDVDGTVGIPSAMLLVLPYSSTPNRSVVLVGDVVSTGVEIQLPMRVNDWGIVNTSKTVELMVRLEPNEAEVSIGPGASSESRRIYTNISQLFIRGNGGTSSMSMMLTLLNQET